MSGSLRMPGPEQLGMASFQQPFGGAHRVYHWPGSPQLWLPTARRRLHDQAVKPSSGVNP